MLMLAIVVGIDTQVTQASLAVVNVDTAGIGQSDSLPATDHYYPQELPKCFIYSNKYSFHSSTTEGHSHETIVVKVTAIYYVFYFVFLICSCLTI